METERKAWNQEKRRRWSWQTVVIGWTLEQGRGTGSALHVAYPRPHLSCQRVPFWFWCQVASVTGEARRQIVFHVRHSDDSVSIVHDWFRTGMWRSHGQWDVKECPLERLWEGFLCSLRENIEGKLSFSASGCCCLLVLPGTRLRDPASRLRVAKWEDRGTGSLMLRMSQNMSYSWDCHLWGPALDDMGNIS